MALEAMDTKPDETTHREGKHLYLSTLGLYEYLVSLILPITTYSLQKMMNQS